MKPAYSQCGDPEISGNDVADAVMDERHKRRESLVRHVCDVMGWDYSQSPVWTGLRKVALAEAIPVGLDKLQEIINKLHEANRKANAAQTLCSNQRQMVDQALNEKEAMQMRIDNALAELDHIADLLADSEELPVGQTAGIRLLNEAIEALSGLPRKKKGE